MTMSQILKFVDHKNIKILISLEQNIIFSSNQNISQFYVKGFFMAKNCFVAEVTFKITFFIDAR